MDRTGGCTCTAFANRSTAFMRAAVRAKRPCATAPGPHLPAIVGAVALEEVSRWTTARRAPSFTRCRTPDEGAAHRRRQVARRRADARPIGRAPLVDDLAASVVGTLDDLGVLDSSYIFYSSDHGYHLGEWKLWRSVADEVYTRIFRAAAQDHAGYGIDARHRPSTFTHAAPPRRRRRPGQLRRPEPRAAADRHARRDGGGAARVAHADGDLVR